MPIPDAILSRIENLDPLPLTVQKLISALSDEGTSLQEIAEVIEHDPAVTANILRVANSASSASIVRLNDPREAVVRLGTAALLNIVLGGYLREFTVSAPLYRLSEDEFWWHSAMCAQAVKSISKHASVPVPPAAVVAALVHDVGKLLIVRFVDTDPGKMAEACRRDDLSFVEAERHLFGFDHAQLGAALARQWNFPEPISQAIERHHEVPLSDSSPLLNAVVLANLVAKTLGVGLGLEGVNLQADGRSRRRLGISFSTYCRICAESASAVNRLKETHGLELAAAVA